MSQSPTSGPHGKDTASPIDEQLQREVEEALGGQSVEQLMEEAAAAPEGADAGTGTGEESGDTSGGPGGSGPREFHHDIRRGRIAAIRGEDVFVDLTGDAGKLQGLVPLVQFSRPPRIGSVMDFVVDRIDEGQGLVFLSREGAVSRSTWDQLQRGAVVEARVVGTNKGGLELEMIGGIRAFMPASQLDLHHVKELEPFVGQKLEGIVQEIDRKSKKVVLSRRQLLQQRREQAMKKLLAELEVDQIREGVVSNIVEFGAFIDLGGIDGLVHVSDMSYGHIDKVGDVLKPGQAVRVKVLKIDPENQRIGLGLKQVEPDPWEGIEARYASRAPVSGKITRTTSFGAFVELEPGIEGLLPLSEMSWQRIHRAEDVVKQGDNVRLVVLHVDPEKRRISLSLKESQGDPWMGAERKYEAKSVIEGKVIGITEFGAFVELEPGVEGLVHISELADHRVAQVEDVLKAGDVKPFRVLDISEDERKVRLSLKQVEQLTEERQASRADIAQHSAKAGGKGPRPAGSAKPKLRSDLKGGMGKGGGLGKGLGDLNLGDLK